MNGALIGKSCISIVVRFCFKKRQDGLRGMRINDNVKTVERFCKFGNALNAGGSSEMTVVARTRIERMRFREREEVLHGRRFSLNTKRRMNQVCVRSAIP